MVHGDLPLPLVVHPAHPDPVDVSRGEEVVDNLGVVVQLVRTLGGGADGCILRQLMWRMRSLWHNMSDYKVKNTHDSGDDFLPSRLLWGRSPEN